MSAYVVATDTIDYLVAAAQKYDATFYAPMSPQTTDLETLAAAPIDWSDSNNMFRIDPKTQPDVVGAILLAQNVRSVNFRYRENDAMPDYRNTTVMFADVDPVQVLKSVACLRYQSCETPDYDKTLAASLLERIEHAAIAHLAGYDDADWGWTRARAAERKAELRTKTSIRLVTH